MKLSQTPEPARSQQLLYMEKAWNRASEHLEIAATDALKFLFAVNAGGAAVTLGFMGAMKTVDPISGAQWMLTAFLLGIIFVGFSRAIRYHTYASMFIRLRSAYQLYASDAIEWSEFLRQTSGDIPWARWATVTAWLSFLTFGVGVGIGYVGLLT